MLNNIKFVKKGVLLCYAWKGMLGGGWGWEDERQNFQRRRGKCDLVNKLYNVIHTYTHSVYSYTRLLNFTRPPSPPPPLVPDLKNWIFRNIPKIRNILFFTVLCMSRIFFGIFHCVLYSIFSDNCMSHLESVILQYSKISQKNEYGYVSNIFWDIPIFQIGNKQVCPIFILEYPGIFQFSNAS